MQSDFQQYRKALIASLMSTALILTACGGGDDDGIQPAATGSTSSVSSSQGSISTTSAIGVPAVASNAVQTSVAVAPKAAATRPSATSASASLTWEASSDPAVVGYRVYYGTEPGVYAQAAGNGMSVGNVTNTTVQGLQSGYTYYFVVTAVDSAGHESSLSEELSKLVS